MLRTREAADPTSVESIQELEKRLGIKFPPAYQDFLLTTNGGRPERDLVLVPGCSASPQARVHFFFGIGDSEESCDLRWNIEEGRELPPGMIPIATTEGADIFCLDRSGRVFFFDGYEGQHYLLAESFERFIGSLFRDEHSPAFDQ